jgi:hypothetical protein
MDGVLLQIILAARRYDEDAGWMQLLVFVIMIVFWAVGSIVKSRSKKAGTEEEKQLEETFSEYKQQMGRQTRPQQKKTAQLRTAARHAPAKKEPFTEPETLKSLEAERLSLFLKETETKAARPDISSEQTQPQAGINFLPDLEGPDSLKRGVIYYEVLGKPLAMRDEPKNIIGP